MAKLAYVDTETTGLDPTRHEPFEIGLVLVNEKEEVYEREWWLPVDLSTADSEALRITRYFEREPKEQSDPLQVAGELAQLTTNAHFLGFTPSFDNAMLERLLRRNGCAPAWHYSLIDVSVFTAGRLGLTPPFDAIALSEKLGVAIPSKEEEHTALADARWSRRLFEAAMELAP